METSETKSEEGNPFYSRYANYSDDEILDILRNHKDYQDRAVSEAVKIAIERELIHSEQDLMAPEFQYQRSAKLSLFPRIVSPYHRNRLVFSLFRFLFVLSFLPIIYGALEYAKGNTSNAVAGFLFGFAWFAFSFLLKRTRKYIFFYFLFAILFGGVIFSGYLISMASSLRFTDVLVMVFASLMSVYFLTYLKLLLKSKSEL